MRRRSVPEAEATPCRRIIDGRNAPCVPAVLVEFAERRRAGARSAQQHRGAK
jgi:hypothetical protein